jgi:hypothetical protein
MVTARGVIISLQDVKKNYKYIVMNLIMNNRMRPARRYLALLINLLLSGMITGYSQEIQRPNFSMKSHETLELQKIQITPEKTVLFLSIENRRQGGSFCADPNTFLAAPGGSRYKLVEASGIPICPESYKFKSIGEKLFFALVFPPIGQETQWFDIIEECDQNCFWFYGIVLDKALNQLLNDAFEAASTAKPEENVTTFRKILQNVDSQNNGIEGLLYVNIINAAIEAGDRVEASVWYKRLRSSGAPRTEYYLKFLNDSGIKF